MAVCLFRNPNNPTLQDPIRDDAICIGNSWFHVRSHNEVNFLGFVDIPTVLTIGSAFYQIESLGNLKFHGFFDADPKVKALESIINGVRLITVHIQSQGTAGQLNAPHGEDVELPQDVELVELPEDGNDLPGEDGMVENLALELQEDGIEQPIELPREDGIGNLPLPAGWEDEAFRVLNRQSLMRGIMDPGYFSSLVLMADGNRSAFKFLKNDVVNQDKIGDEEIIGALSFLHIQDQDGRNISAREITLHQLVADQANIDKLYEVFLTKRATA